MARKRELVLGIAGILMSSGPLVGLGLHFLDDSKERAWQREIAAFDDAIGRTPPDRARLLNDRGLAYARHGDLALAQQDFDASIALDASIPEVFLNRASVRKKLGNESGADSDLARAFQLARNAPPPPPARKRSM